jgi:competence protein ComEA
VRLKLDEASLEDLVGLPGIGEARATRIIEYRSQNGSFRSLDELGEATGMNGALLEQLGELIEL